MRSYVLTGKEGEVWTIGRSSSEVLITLKKICKRRSQHFVFVDHKENCKNSDVVQKLQLDNTKIIIALLRQEKGLSEQQAASFLMNYEFYIHGIASYTASGFVNYPEEAIITMANRAKDLFLANEMREKHET